MLISRIVAHPAALVAVGLVGVSGCAGRSESHAAVSAAELQKVLVAQLAEARTPTTWVTCAKDLPARVGATTRCDVMFNQADAVTAILTTTQVQGDAVTWEVTRPEMTKDQVTRRVAGLWLADAVTCNSGLGGNIGDWAQCEVTKGGMTANQTLEVTSVQGLALDITPTLSLPKQQAEDMLRNKLNAVGGEPPELTTCPGDLVGSTGITMDCAATIDGRPQTYTLSVSDAGKGAVDFQVAPPPPAEALAGSSPVEAVPELAPVEAAPAPAPVEAAPAPAPVQVTPVYKPAPSKAVVPEPPPAEGVPHLPPGDAVPAPGPDVTLDGLIQMITQAAGG